MNLSLVIVRPVELTEESRSQQMMQKYHYLGALPKIGNMVWYVVICNNEWFGLLSFSASALKCGARDRWIGWGHRLQYDRLHLVVKHSRLLILLHCHHKNLASKILSRCKQRIQRDWLIRFGFPRLFLETFLDPTRFVATIYHAANWELAGKTKGYQRICNGYSTTHKSLRLVFVQLLQRKALATPAYVKGGIKIETYRRPNEITSRFL